ncbi:ArsB/NhaD family transporter, partial [Bacillus pumilus]|uniref:ArsB/NhaD family transporter n=1 Tax=Bacillus pumilus TaxID=1408 RepID=UPI0034D960F4
MGEMGMLGLCWYVVGCVVVGYFGGEVIGIGVWMIVGGIGVVLLWVGRRSG